MLRPDLLALGEDRGALERVGELAHVARPARGAAAARAPRRRAGARASRARAPDADQQRPRPAAGCRCGARAAAAGEPGTPPAGGRGPRGSAPACISARRSRLVAAIQRTSASIVCVPPTRSKRRSWSTRSSFACSSGLSSPISSRKNVPPSASSMRPRRRCRGAGERALLVAEQLALEQRLRQRGAVDRHERSRRALAPGVQRARGDLLAGAALARAAARSRRCARPCAARPPPAPSPGSP